MEQQAPNSQLNLRKDFPIFERVIGDRPLVYLDSGATSQKPLQVIEAIDDYYRNHNANIHRGVYQLAAEATDMFEGARERIAEFCGSSIQETVFTRNATEAINLVAYSWGNENIGPGDVILITEMEHHSNLVPWQLLAQRRGAELRYVEIDDEGLLNREQFSAEIGSGKVKLFAVTHVSNVLGTINPVKELVAEAHTNGVHVLVDGSQAVPQLPVSCQEIDADFYVWTGHKVLGPTGIGILHGRRELLEEMQPFLAGGDMIKSVGLQSSKWNDLPWKFEAGTSPIAEAIGLGAAISYITDIGIEKIYAHEQELTRYALDQLVAIPGLKVVGTLDPTKRGGLISFEIDGIHPHDVAEIVNRHNVCVRAGHHCAQPLMQKLGVSATTRASFGPYNEASDVESLVEALKNAVSIFKL